MNSDHTIANTQEDGLRDNLSQVLFNDNVTEGPHNKNVIDISRSVEANDGAMTSPSSQHEQLVESNKRSFTEAMGHFDTQVVKKHKSSDVTNENAPEVEEPSMLIQHNQSIAGEAETNAEPTTPIEPGTVQQTEEAVQTTEINSISNAVTTSGLSTAKQAEEALERAERKSIPPPKTAEELLLLSERKRRFSSVHKEKVKKLQQVDKLVYNSLIEHGGVPINYKAFEEIMEKIKSLDTLTKVKYEAATVKKLNKPVPQGWHHDTPEKVRDCLRGSAERLRPWFPSPDMALPNDGLLMRVTDEASKGKVENDQGGLSWGADSKFHTFEGRQYELTQHVNFRSNWKGPLISTSGCPLEFFGQKPEPWFPKVIDHYIARDRNKASRCTIKLHFINAPARLAAQWPILNFKAELDHYKVKPSHGDFSYFQNEYILPFRIPVEQLVGTWLLSDVEEYMDEHGCDRMKWYEDVVLPAYKEHEAARLEGRAANLRDACVCCGHNQHPSENSARYIIRIKNDLPKSAGVNRREMLADTRH